MRALCVAFSLGVLLSSASIAAQVSSGSFKVNINLTTNPTALSAETISTLSQGVCSSSGAAGSDTIVCVTGVMISLGAYITDNAFLTSSTSTYPIFSNPTLSPLISPASMALGVSGSDGPLEFLVNF